MAIIGESIYIDDQGREVFVSDGIGRGEFWGVFRRKPTGTLQRIKSIPMVPDIAEAGKNLADYAEQKRWKKKTRLEPEDKVVMVNCYEAEKYEDKVWTVASEPWRLGHGEEVVLLEGFHGGFATECLRKVDA